MAGFSATVEGWVRESLARMLAVFRTSAQMVIEQAELPRGKGGNMRVDTGFMRASGVTSLNSVAPIRPGYVPPASAGPNSVPYDTGPTALVIAGANLGDTIYHGYTAAYAGYRENKDGFVRLAAMDWQNIVNRATEQAKKRAG